MVYDGRVAARDGEAAAIFNPDNLPYDNTPHHFSHCIDMLKNSLMCRPDTTIELKDVEIGGVTGYGAEHLCVNWDQLVGWVSKWENYGKDTISHKGSSASS